MKKLILLIVILAVTLVIAGCPQPGQSILSSDGSVDEESSESALAGNAVAKSKVKVTSCQQTKTGITVVSYGKTVSYRNGCVGQNLLAYSCLSKTSYQAATNNCNGNGCTAGRCNAAPEPAPAPTGEARDELPLFYDVDLDGSVSERDVSCWGNVLNGDRACLRVPERRLSFSCQNDGQPKVQAEDNQIITRLWFDRALPANVIDANLDLIADCQVYDWDLDGIIFKDDNCPFSHNPDQQNSDGDTPGNSCDGNNDNDQLTDSNDNCPLIVNDDQLDSDNNGVGDACEFCYYLDTSGEKLPAGAMYPGVFATGQGQFRPTVYIQNPRSWVSFSGIVSNEGTSLNQCEDDNYLLRNCIGIGLSTSSGVGYTGATVPQILEYPLTPNTCTNDRTAFFNVTANACSGTQNRVDTSCGANQICVVGGFGYGADYCADCGSRICLNATRQTQQAVLGWEASCPQKYPAGTWIDSGQTVQC